MSKIEPLGVPTEKHKLRDIMTLYRAILKINEIIEALNVRNTTNPKAGGKKAST